MIGHCAECGRDQRKLGGVRVHDVKGPPIRLGVPNFGWCHDCSERFDAHIDEADAERGQFELGSRILRYLDMTARTEPYERSPSLRDAVLQLVTRKRSAVRWMKRRAAAFRG